jgi:hypothetical protein
VEDLENQVRQLRDQNLELEKRAQEATRKLTLTETDLDKAEERAESFEAKARALEQELTRVRFLRMSRTAGAHADLWHVWRLRSHLFPSLPSASLDCCRAALSRG